MPTFATTDTSHLTDSIGDIKRAHKELVQARHESDRLFEILLPQFLYDRPIAERHRVVFYVGHLDAFDYIQNCREGLGVQSPEPALDALFQAGIDPDSGHLPMDAPSDWPTLDRIKAYVNKTREAVDRLLEEAPADAVHMALEHRLMHLETLAYMFHNFPHEKKTRPPLSESITGSSAIPVHSKWCTVEKGEAVLGKARDGSFGWDNEYSEHRVTVPAFRMQRYKVTNGEYLRFVDDGAPLPSFWVRSGDGLNYRGMFESIPLPMDWPAYVTQREAQAYAGWLGKELPSEQQFHRAAFGTHSQCSREYPWGNSPPNHTLGNFDFKRWDPEPVTATSLNESAFGVLQMLGNGWEWTNTQFGPFEGFAASPHYPGYSANFFDSQHFVLKGGSPRTAARLLRRSFRNWFRPDYPYVYATFRCVEN
ncbi:MAG: SUMF1/EgtB/PvdO family nonheme iron enzyme [Bryobacteraceae bacterium]